MAASSAAVARKTTGRKDPASRHVDGLATSRKGNRFLLVANPDPRYVYAWVWKADEQTGVPFYESNGYEIVLASQDGPRPAAVRKPQMGAPFEFRGMVLMQIEKEEYDRIQREGVDGDGGSQWADMIEQRINRQRRADNPFAGAPGSLSRTGNPYVSEDPDTSSDPEDLNHG